MKKFKDMKDIIKAENRKKKNIRIYIAALLAVQLLMLPFSGCASLESLELPEGVAEFGYDPFYGCKKLFFISHGGRRSRYTDR